VKLGPAHCPSRYGAEPVTPTVLTGGADGAHAGSRGTPPCRTRLYRRATTPQRYSTLSCNMVLNQLPPRYRQVALTAHTQGAAALRRVALDFIAAHRAEVKAGGGFEVLAYEPELLMELLLRV